MECVVIILVVIGIGISIVVAAFKKAEEERQRNQVRPRGDGARGPMRRPGTDLDRFLEEARRRREAGGGEPAPRPVADAPWAVPVNRAPVQRPDVQGAPAVQRGPDRPRQSTQSTARRPTTEARPPIPTAQVAPPRASPPARPQQQAPVVLELVPDDQPAPLALPAELQAPPPPPPKTGGRPAVVPANLKQLPGMLRQPNSLATAFTLGVIFGPPVSRRFR